MKKIIIGGCSFSQFMNENSPWKSWTNFLDEEYREFIGISNRAQSSYGQGAIVENVLYDIIIKNYDVDLVIVQWSAIGRGMGTNQKDFFKKVLDDHSGGYMLTNSIEYFGNGITEDEISDKMNRISNSFVRHSLLQIKLLKDFLTLHNIPHLFYWGWEQLTDESTEEYRSLVDSIYSNSWWLPDGNTGMSEYVVKKSGNNALLPRDFHPTTESHKYFYDTIINPYIKKNIL